MIICTGTERGPSSHAATSMRDHLQQLCSAAGQCPPSAGRRGERGGTGGGAPRAGRPRSLSTAGRLHSCAGAAAAASQDSMQSSAGSELLEASLSARAVSGAPLVASPEIASKIRPLVYTTAVTAPANYTPTSVAIFTTLVLLCACLRC